MLGIWEPERKEVPGLCVKATEKVDTRREEKHDE